MTEPTSESRPRSDGVVPSGDAAQPEGAVRPEGAAQPEDAAQAVDAARLDPAQSALGRLAALPTADHLEVYTQIADDLAARLASPGVDQAVGSDQAATEPDRRSNA